MALRRNHLNRLGDLLQDRPIERDADPRPGGTGIMPSVVSSGSLTTSGHPKSDWPSWIAGFGEIGQRGEMDIVGAADP